MQLTRCGRDSWLLYYCSVLNVMSLFNYPSSSALGLSVVCDISFSGYTHLLFVVILIERYKYEPAVSNIPFKAVNDCFNKMISMCQ